MNSVKVVVPDGMLQAAVGAMKEPSGTKFRSTEQWATIGLEAALRWLAENPVVPTERQWRNCLAAYDDAGKTWYECATLFVTEWQRRMFLAPEPEVPEAVKDLLCAGADTDKEAYFRPDIYNERIIEAYHRGLGSNRSAQKAR